MTLDALEYLIQLFTYFQNANRYLDAEWFTYLKSKEKWKWNKIWRISYKIKHTPYYTRIQSNSAYPLKSICKSVQNKSIYLKIFKSSGGNIEYWVLSVASIVMTWRRSFVRQTQQDMLREQLIASITKGHLTNQSWLDGTKIYL